MKPTEDSPPPETIEEIVNRELDVYRQEINGLNAQNELLREFVERQSRGIRNRDRLLRWMLVLLIFVVAYAVYLTCTVWNLGSSTADTHGRCAHEMQKL